MYSILISILLNFPILVAIQNIFNISVNTNIIYGLMLIIALMYRGKKNNRTHMALFIIIIYFIIQFIFQREYTVFQSLLIFNNIMLTLTFINSFEIHEIMDIFIDRLKQLNMMIIIMMLINIFYFLNPLGWMNLWDGNQYISIYKFPHDACYMFVGLQAYSIVLYYLNEKSIFKVLNKLFVIILTMFALFTNSRTPFALSMVITIYFLYKTTNNKILYVLAILNIITIFIWINYYSQVIDLAKIPIVSKFIRGVEVGNFSSSRDIIWGNILSYYKDTFSFNENVIGGGFGISRHINNLYMGQSLWSHNDFLEILISGGIFLLIYYFNKLIKVLMMSNNYILMISVIVVSYFNGFYAYPQIIICMPALVLAFKLIKSNYVEICNYNK